jgi:hypothetical protein
MIDSCGFGFMTIDGQRYDSDLMIFPDGRILDHWWRQRGHRFSLNDLEALIATRPEVLIAGTGIYGLVKIDPGLRQALSRDGIELIAKRTKKAVQAFNQAIQRQGNIAGCFHLTC